jgi:predicted O-methyltransferase YrrM
MASEPLVGALLRSLAASKPGGRFLELGTGTGLATAWLLVFFWGGGMDDRATLISVDYDAKVQRGAKDILGQDRRLTLVTGGAADFLRSQSPRSFDLVFADAMPGKYEDLESALAVVKAGGFYVIDDTNAEFQILPLVWASGVVIAVRKS